MLGLYSLETQLDWDRRVKLPLDWNEIRGRAVAFGRDWEDVESERAEAKSFWDEFFKVFGITRRRVASFEEPVKRLLGSKSKTSTGYIDLFWKGTLIVEHKSAGRDLDRAYTQAIDYFPGIPERDLPRYVLVSDFKRFRLFDLEAGENHEFKLGELAKNINLFAFIAGYVPRQVREQDPVNLKAAEKMGRLHDLLKESGYSGHDLEVLLVRLLFCLFADDTGIFQPVQMFREWIENETREDGTDLGPRLTELFQVLNTSERDRQKALSELMAAFPYVNGDLFKEQLAVPSFDGAMRAELLDASRLDWGGISPAIFGGLFQSIMDPRARRSLGAHYTSEANILKVIEPLFLDELRAEVYAARRNVNKLFEIQKRLRRLTFLDPACGCGNFLVVAYRELRLLELETIRLATKTDSRFLDIQGLVQVNVDQFYGMEIEEFPAQIAKVALWLTDHQMNQLVSKEFGQYFARLPLTTGAHIVHCNALETDWSDIVPSECVSFILGNPPFIGKKEQTPKQKQEILNLFAGSRGASALDYVAGWYVKAARFMEGTDIRCGLVSTNSITQGEQPALLWPTLWKHAIRIQFAHRTFVWSNEGRGVAAVHCVIVGFKSGPVVNPVLFDHDSSTNKYIGRAVNQINPYLVEADNVVLPKRRGPLSAPREISYGSMPNDGGHLLLTSAEKNELVRRDPKVGRWIRPFLGSEEFINGIERWCLWLEGIEPSDLRGMADVIQRVNLVRTLRSESSREQTRRLANQAYLFGENRQPTVSYLAIPKTSSSLRRYIPMAVLPPRTVASTELFTIAGAGHYELGVLQSAAHMAWVQYTCGRLKSDFRYSAEIVYNNFPWPAAGSGPHRTKIEKAAADLVQVRKQFAHSTLAELYDPDSMPVELSKAHETLDRAVDTAYGFGRTPGDAVRVAKLFSKYVALDGESDEVE